MKDLYKFLKEDGEATSNATPGNTMGMGDPVVDDGEGNCSEPLTVKAKKEKRKHKKRKSEEE